MKTPFDGALRIRRREIDQTRIAIHAETARMAAIDDASRALHDELASEYRAAAEGLAMPSDAFIRRRLSDRARLVARRSAVAQEIDLLRGRVTEAFGSMQVMEEAADAFRTDVRRRQQQAEQRAADDLGAARIARRPAAAADPAPMPVSVR